ncbi:MAG: helix-turn-helix domain-containing protein, partial [Rhizobiaceae bacterium]
MQWWVGLTDVVVLNDDERLFLESQVRRHKAPRSLSDRCRAILLCAEGLESKEVARQMNVHEHTVGKWRCRFGRDRIEGLTDEHRPGRPRTVSDDRVAERRPHTYIRHGTTSLFAALDIATGAVIGKCYKRHRAKEFLNFLKQIDAHMPQGPDVHL